MSGRSLSLSLEGLQLAPAQVWGAVRLVPVLREKPISDLRLHRRCLGSLTSVVVAGSLEDPKVAYTSYVPHAFVVRWGDDASSDEALMGTALTKGTMPERQRFARLGLTHRMVKRERRGLRFLPLHLAMEGFLAYQFGGPPTIFSEYSREVIRRGLSPRIEWALRGRALPDLDDALRVFEVHPRQVGVLLFVGDVFTSAFILPRHLEYRALHRSLLSDFFADTFLYHAANHPEVPDWQIDVSDVKPSSLGDLRAFLERTRRDWAEFHEGMADGLFGKTHRAMERYRLGRFTLHQFLPRFDLGTENHIGETILDEQGQTAYLKTYSLSRAQTRRGFLLQQLAAAGWDLEVCAGELSSSRDELILRLRNAGFGYLLKPHVLADATRRR